VESCLLSVLMSAEEGRRVMEEKILMLPLTTVAVAPRCVRGRGCIPSGSIVYSHSWSCFWKPTMMRVRFQLMCRQARNMAPTFCGLCFFYCQSFGERGMGLFPVSLPCPLNTQNSLWNRCSESWIHQAAMIRVEC
jgi:hypothetical protein